jgi:hypothetical protein
LALQQLDRNCRDRGGNFASILLTQIRSWWSTHTWQGAAALISRVLFQVYCEGWRAFSRAGDGTLNLLFHVIDGQLNVGR